MVFPRQDELHADRDDQAARTAQSSYRLAFIRPASSVSVASDIVDGGADDSEDDHRRLEWLALLLGNASRSQQDSASEECESPMPRSSAVLQLPRTDASGIPRIVYDAEPSDDEVYDSDFESDSP